jgi:hypothetical protein
MPPRRDARLGVPRGAVAAAIGAVAFFAPLGLSLRILRFDIPAPLLGSPRPASSPLLAVFGLAAQRPTPWLLETRRRSTGACDACSPGGVHRRSP